MIRKLFPILALSLPLAACAAGSAAPRPQSRPAIKLPTPVRPPVKSPPPRAQVLTAPGLEGVIGATAGDLTRQFGPARLDVWEGDARKLQFASPTCVLDIYLYPPGKGTEPQATYVDARRSSDGQDVDRAACILALRGR